MYQAFLEHDKTLRNTGVINPKLYMTKGMFDWPMEELQDFYRGNIEKIAKNLKVVPGAKRVIEQLKQEGNTIIIITSRNNGDYSHPYEMTYEWLSENHILFDELVLVHSPFEKVFVCQDKQVDIMIDDSIKVCGDVSNIGILSVLMKHTVLMNKQKIFTILKNMLK